MAFIRVGMGRFSIRPRPWGGFQKQIWITGGGLSGTESGNLGIRLWSGYQELVRGVREARTRKTGTGEAMG